MNRYASLLVLTIVLFYLIGCSDNKSNDDFTITADTDFLAEFTLLGGGNFLLKVNRIVNHPDVQFPYEELEEIDYQNTSEGRQYEVSFSENIETITILPDSISGTLEKDENELKQYVLVKGLFAGGRFIIWITNNKFEAEFTIYGSGVPIIQSERGCLEPI